MKKKVASFYVLAFVCLVALMVVNVRVAVASSASFGMSAYTGEGGSGEGGSSEGGGGESGGGESGYKIHNKNCAISEMVDGDLYITVSGRKFKVTGVSVGGTYSKEWKDAARDCEQNGTFSCSTYTCGDFYKTLPSTL